MIRSVTIEAFKGLGRVELELAPLTVLVGANGSGKSSVLQGIEGFRHFAIHRHPSQAMDLARRTGCPGSFGVRRADGARGEVRASPTTWLAEGLASNTGELGLPAVVSCGPNPRSLAAPSRLTPGEPALRSDGAGLAAHVSNLRLEHPQRFEELLSRLRKVVPSVEMIRSRLIHGRAESDLPWECSGVLRRARGRGSVGEA